MQTVHRLKKNQQLKKKSTLKKRKDPPTRRFTATKAKRNYLEMKERHKKGLNKLKH